MVDLAEGFVEHRVFPTEASALRFCFFFGSEAVGCNDFAHTVPQHDAHPLQIAAHGRLADADLLGDVLAGGDAPGVIVRLFPAGNTGVTIGPGTELQRDPATGAASIGYEVTLMGLNPVGHAAPLVSPVFDSIQISYFLPREEVVLFEKVVE